MKYIKIILITLLISGCASGPYSKKVSDNYATLTTKTTCCFSDGLLHYSYVIYIDGVHTESLSGKFYLPPGKRQLGLAASLAPGKKAYAVVNLDAQENYKYYLRVEEEEGTQIAKIYLDKEVVLSKAMEMYYGREYTAGEETQKLLFEKIQESR